MGCIIKYRINESAVLGIWRIEEDLDMLRKAVVLQPEEKKRFKSFSSTSRKFEFLSVRAMLSELTGGRATIIYNKNNKPFIKDGSMFISISHSHQLTAVMLSTSEKVGIDLEYMRKNIASVALRFINVREKITKDPANKLYHLYLHWCAKEALYKICDKEGISIRNNITVEPFDVHDSGEITGSVHTDAIHESFDMKYINYDNYAIVWTQKFMTEPNLNVK